MRRLLLTLSLIFVVASCADDPDAETTGAVPAIDGTSSTTTSVIPPTSVSSTTTLPPPSSTIVTPTVPTTTTEPLYWPTELRAGATLPVVLLVDGLEVMSYRVLADGFVDRSRVYDRNVPKHPVTHVHQSGEGYLFTREWDDAAEDNTVIEFVRYHFDAGREVLDVEWIFDVAVVNGIESVIVAAPSPDGFGFGGVEAWAVDDLRLVARLGLAAEAEFGVTDFHWSEAAGMGVASAWSDLTEWIGFVSRDGESIELPSPTDDLDYNAPPYVTAATLSADGSMLYWAEGPDWGFDPATNESGPIEAAWVLHGADVETGETSLVWPLSEPVLDSTVLEVHSILPLADFILINRTALRGTESVVLAPLVLDLSGEEPELYEFPAVGIVTEWAV